MEPAFIIEELQIEYQSDQNLVDNMTAIVSEFRKTRKLQPLKILVHGPPAVGKTRIAKQLCGYYGIHYLNPQIVIEQTIKEMVRYNNNV